MPTKNHRDSVHEQTAIEIRRQHETTTIDELAGTACTNLLSVGPGSHEGFYFCYLKASETWYRFFIHYGILFWDTAAPVPEDDLADGERYGDVLENIGATKCEGIETVEMDDSCLKITFSGGLELLFEEIEETGRMSIVVA